MLLFSCKDDIDTTFEDINITTEENTIVEVNIPKALGNTSISNAINSAINKEVIADLHIGEPESIRTTTIKESITTFNKEFDNFQTDFPETTQVW